MSGPATADVVASVVRAAAGSSLDVRGASGRWIALHSRRDPRAEAERWLQAVAHPATADLAHACRGAIIIGAGEGHLLDVLYDHAPDARVLVLEPLPDIADRLAHDRRWSEAIGAGRLAVYAGPEFAGAQEAWRLISDAPDDPALFVHPVLAREFPDRVARARAVAERVTFNLRANRDARRRFAGRYLLNTLANIDVLAREADVAALRGAFDGVPAIVVAAGPSLDRNVAAIRAAASRAVIICVDTALRPLIAADIAPHLVVALDPSEVNGRHLRDLPALPRTHLVAEPSVDSCAFDTFAGRTFAFRVADHHPWPWLSSLGLDCGLLRAWGSVVTSAFDLALVTGANPIVFAGLDLAFTGDRPYCRHTTYEEDWAEQIAGGGSLQEIWKASIERWPLSIETGIDGGAVRTAPHLLAFRDWLVAQVAASPDRRIVNATGAGLLQGKGLEQSALERLMCEWPVRDPLISNGVTEAWRDGASKRAMRPKTMRAPAAAGGTEAALLDEMEKFTGGAGPGHALHGPLEEAQHRLSNLPPRRADRRPPSPAGGLPLPERTAMLQALLTGRAVPEWVTSRYDEIDSGKHIAGAAALLEDLLESPVHDQPRATAVCHIDWAGTHGRKSVEFPVTLASLALPLTGLVTPYRPAPHPPNMHGQLALQDGSRSSGTGPNVAVTIRGTSTMDVRQRFLAADLPPVNVTVLTDRSLDRCLFATSETATTALLTRYDGGGVCRLREDGTVEKAEDWPRPAGGLVVVEGYGIAWENRGRSFVMLRSPAGTTETLDVTFVPQAATRTPDGRVWLAADDGLWLWEPGSATRRVLEQPHLVFVDHGEGGELRLDGADAVTRRATRAWSWDPCRGQLRELSSDQPRWWASRQGEWTAEACYDDDIVRLRDRTGGLIELFCHRPRALAWAGTSLVVTSGFGHVLHFPRLLEALELRARR